MLRGSARFRKVLRLRKQPGVAPRKGCADRGWCHRGVDTSPRRFFDSFREAQPGTFAGPASQNLDQSAVEELRDQGVHEVVPSDDAHVRRSRKHGELRIRQELDQLHHIAQR